MKYAEWIHPNDTGTVRRRQNLRGRDEHIVRTTSGPVPVGDIAEEFRSGATVDALAVKHKVSSAAVEAALRTCMRARRSRP